jgi:PmbA protein
VALTRTIAVDPFRALPDPALYQGRANLDLQLYDPRQATLTPTERRRVAEELEAAARAAPHAKDILSVTSGFYDSTSQLCQVHSNGFEGTSQETSFGVSCSVSMKDADGRRPEDYDSANSRFHADLAAPSEVGRRATERTARRLGSRKVASAVVPMVLENRAAGRLVGFLFGALSARALQQKSSFLDGKLGKSVASAKLTLTDDPHLTRGFASRLWDEEGIAAKPFPVFDKGVLRSFYVDTYYGKKLKMAPTTSGRSNLKWALGSKGLDALVAEVTDGFWVTEFLGGNSNGTTGDFSLGVQGFRIHKGQRAEPVSEMNISGNHLAFWSKLAEVGNDPYPYSSARTPTLLFDAVQFAGA